MIVTKIIVDGLKNNVILHNKQCVVGLSIYLFISVHLTQERATAHRM
jgi:hypothetical protein